MARHFDIFFQKSRTRKSEKWVVSTQNVGRSDQLAGPVQYGTIDDTEVVTEPLASQGASTEGIKGCVR